MGYIIAGIVVVIGILLVAFLMSGGGTRVRGRVSPAGDKPVERANPSAESPTPGASDTAGSRTVDRAQDRIPPA
jgi:hypothetical protein